MSAEKKDDVCLSCNKAGIDQTIADWAGVPVEDIHETTPLNGLGGKTFPDVALATSLAELCPEKRKKIMENYPTWTIVEDAEDDCMVIE